MNKRRKRTKAEKRLRREKNRAAGIKAVEDVLQEALALELKLLAPDSRPPAETTAPVSD